MNKYNTYALGVFMSVENEGCLYKALMGYWGPTVTMDKTLSKILRPMMNHFYAKAAKNLMYSEPIDEGNPVEQVQCLNNYFLTDAIEFIDKYYIKCGERNDLVNNTTYTWNDGRVATADTSVRKAPRQTISEQDTGKIKYVFDGQNDIQFKVTGGRPVTNELGPLSAQWYPSQGRQARDDIPGDRDVDQITANYCTDANGGVNAVTGVGFYFDGTGTFADTGVAQSVETFNSSHRTEENTASAINMFMNDPKIQLLNVHSCGKFNDQQYTSTKGKDYSTPDSDPQYNVKLWADDNGFIDESDKTAFGRYLNRRTFQNWSVNPCTPWDSADAQIPFWVRNVHHRHVDRINLDSLDGNVERGNILGKYDMRSAHCRVSDNQRHYRSVYDSNGGNIERPESARVWDRQPHWRKCEGPNNFRSYFDDWGRPIDHPKGGGQRIVNCRPKK